MLNAGHFVYPLDDPYIHMAMAKNFSQHGVWGVTRYGFTSSSSSPLWVLLLSLVYLVTGPKEAALLILNLAIALLGLVIVDRLMARRGLGPWSRLWVLCGLVVLIPLPAMVLTGQEHVLQSFVSFLFLWIGAEAVAGLGPKFNRLLVGLGFLLVAVRYEGAFLVAVVVLLLLLRRRTLLGLVLAGAALVPIAAYGIVSASQGWYFLPNSVLMKAQAMRNAVHLIRAGRAHPGFWKGLANLAGFWGLRQVATTPHILAPAVAVLVLLVIRLARRGASLAVDTAAGLVFLAVVFLHMQFAGPGALHRYEAYLVGLGIAAGVLLLRGLTRDRANNRPLAITAATVAGLAASVMLWEGAWVMRQVPRWTNNIYQENYHMGLFLRRFYQGEAVAANDVGAINYLADIRCFDTWGLATMEVARLKARGRLSSEALGDMAESAGVRIAVVYEDWLKLTQTGAVPARWSKVGCWSILDNLACGCDSVAFFACRPEEQARLKDCLRQFSASLPRAVVQTGAYVSGQ